MESGMVSIKEIAKYCGVSTATVSKAMNDKNDIGEETKKRIREAAEILGYFPSATARALRTKKSYSIGVLFAGKGGKALTDEFFSHVVNAFKVAAEKRGYEILFLNKEVGDQGMTYLEHCRYRGVDGVLVAYVQYQDPEVIELLQSDIPIVVLDHIFDGKTSVCFDYDQGIKDLITYIYEMGHCKIAYIHGEDCTITRKRVEGFYKTMAELGLSVPDEYVKEGEYLNYHKAAKLTKELLELPDPPTCIIYPNDFSALGGIGSIYERKLSIPQDISVAGYDGIPLAKAFSPELTTLEQDSVRMGEMLANKLIDQIECAGSVPVERLMVQGKVLPGKSVKRQENDIKRY